MNILNEKIKEMLLAILPITVIVMILKFTILPLNTDIIVKFLLGALLIIFGLAFFLLGVDLGIEPIGQNIGETIVKSRKIIIFIISGFILGFLITIAEPDVSIYASQVEKATTGLLGKWELVLSISLGIGVMLSLGLVKIAYSIPLWKILAIFYTLILFLSIFAPQKLLGVPFDAAGATTGSMTVPFMLSLGMGVSSMKSTENVEEESFGLTAIASIGPILTVLLTTIFSKNRQITNEITENISEKNVGIILDFFHEIPHVSYDVFMSLLPIVLIFLILQIFVIKMKRDDFTRKIKGVIYTYLGLVIFLVGVNAGFLDAGKEIGSQIVRTGNTYLIIPLGFLIGLCIILAEPAVHILCEEVEKITGGHIKKPIILFTMALGVALAIVLSMIRILVPSVQLWHYLLVGYLIALSLMFFIPKIFVGIAFDSGGVASGPMSVTFVLALAQGISSSFESSDILTDSFGIISVIALAPIISMEILGLIYKIKLKNKRVK